MHHWSLWSDPANPLLNEAPPRLRLLKEDPTNPSDQEERLTCAQVGARLAPSTKARIRLAFVPPRATERPLV
jgi:hypothetical protein